MFTEQYCNARDNTVSYFLVCVCRSSSKVPDDWVAIRLVCGLCMGAVCYADDVFLIVMQQILLESNLLQMSSTLSSVLIFYLIYTKILECV